MSASNGRRQRSLEIEIFRTSFHEAGHAVANYLLDRSIEEVMVKSREEMEAMLARGLGSDDFAGHVLSTEEPIECLSDAIDEILFCLAGEATVRAAWALQVIDDVSLGIEEPAPELERDEALEVILKMPPGVTPVAAAVFNGYESGEAKGDIAAAEHLAAEWTHTSQEALALMRFATIRVSEWTQTERFQYLAGRLAAGLLEQNTMDGSLATHLLERADAIYSSKARRPA